MVLDDHGRFGLTTSMSRTNSKDKVVRSTLVSADLLQDILNDSKAERQVVLLDCCYRQPSTSASNPHLGGGKPPSIFRGGGGADDHDISDPGPPCVCP
ncbi:hypothetical protein [Acaryochloris sp. 'Moss Beach']|uniref:hypothetical protein n=1 Tax=Acaryochloris sp. 'Moss Beach' TaxID=2740837 RepID=UPI001F2EA480|nr:hypothetical protein [Acaryochloris sp. 'Moss Beach']